MAQRSGGWGSGGSGSGASAGSSVSIRRGWRRGDRQKGDPPKSSRGKRIFYSLLLVGLVGALVWWLMFPSQQVHFAYLSAGYGPRMDDDMRIDVALFAPPLAADADSDFNRNFGVLGETFYPKPFTIENLVAGGKSARNVADNLAASLPTEEVDSYVLYVNAHGMAIDGKPYLLWNKDYQALIGSDGSTLPKLYPLSDLLKAVQSAKAKQRLLIFDAGQISADPRLGLFVNEFPRLLEKELAKSDYVSDNPQYEPLWVLASHSSLESSHVWPDDRRSVFGDLVVRAMRGAPWYDKESAVDEESDISIYQFYEYIHRHVRRAIKNGSDDSQTPMFLVGGQGRIAPIGVDPDAVSMQAFPKRDLLLRISYLPGKIAGQEEAATETASHSPRTSSPGGGQFASAGRFQPHSALLATGPALIAQAEPPAASPPPADAPPVSPGANDPASPSTAEGAAAEKGADAKTADGKTDAAPAPEAGPAPEAAAPADIEKPVAAPVAKGAESAPISTDDPFDRAWSLCDEIENPNSSVAAWSPIDYAPHLWADVRRNLIWHRIHFALEADRRTKNEDYLKKEIIQPLERLRQNLPAGSITPVFIDVDEAQQNFMLGPYYSEIESMTGPAAEVRRAVRLRNFLTFHVSAVIRDYGALSDPQGTTHDRVAEIIDDLRDLSDRLERAEGGNLGEFGRSGIPELVDQLERKKADLVSPRQLAEAIVRKAVADPKGAPSASSGVLPRISDRAQALWCDLYFRWIALETPGVDPVDPVDALIGSSERFDRKQASAAIELVQNAARGRIGSDDEAYWNAYRLIGQMIRSHYFGYRARIHAVSPDDLAALRLQERILRMVDGCDARQAARVPGDNSIPRRRWRPAIDPHVALVDPVNELNLGPRDRRQLAFRYTWDGDRPAKARVALEYRDPIQGSDAISIVGEPFEFDLQSPGGMIDQFEVEPNKSPSADVASTSARLVLRIDAPNKTYRHEFLVNVFGQEFVDVELTEAIKANDPSKDAPLSFDRRPTRRDLVDSAGKPIARLIEWEVRPFPNRKQDFRLRLNNLSGQVAERKVLVELFLIDEPFDRSKTGAFDGDLKLKVGHTPLPRFRREMTLVRGQAVEFPFIPPESAAPAPMNKEKPAPVADAPPAAPEKKDDKNPPPVGDARFGLIVKITDQGDAANCWIHWLEFRPREPAAYVEPIVKYDNVEGNLTVRVNPSGSARPANGYSVRLDTEQFQTQIESLPQKTSAVVADSSVGATLFINRFFPTKKLPVYVSIDDYPRAFVYELSPDSTGELEPWRNYRNVRIMSPPDKTALGKNVDPMKEEADEMEIAFELQVDAEPQDRIQVDFADLPPWNAAADRAEHATIVEAGKQGVMKIDTRVSDFRGTDAVRFRTSETNRMLAIVAEVDDGSRTIVDRRELIVDSAMPTMDQIKLGEETPVEGKPLAAQALATDAGGIESVKFFVLPSGERLEDDAKLTATTGQPDKATQPNVGPTLWQAEIDAEELGLKPEREYTLWAIAADRVGHRRKQSGATFRMQKKPAPTPMAGAVAGVSIKGKALYFDQAQQQIKITLTPKKGTEGEARTVLTMPVIDPLVPQIAGQPPVVTWEYEFKNVKPGGYLITAEGVAGARKVVHAEPVDLTFKTSDQDPILRDVKLTISR